MWFLKIDACWQWLTVVKSGALAIDGGTVAMLMCQGLLVKNKEEEEKQTRKKDKAKGKVKERPKNGIIHHCKKNSLACKSAAQKKKRYSIC